MPRKTDFTVTPAGAVIRAAILEEYRAQSARLVSLPRVPAVIGHSRLSAFAPVEALATLVH